MRKFHAAIAAVVAIALVVVATAATSVGGQTRVTIGSNPTPFPQNKQNEPAVAINPIAPNIVAAGANDEIDLEGCNVAADNTCPFTAGIGVSGVYFSTNGGDNWSQPTYTGWSARSCLGVAGTATDTCSPSVGPIGTLPRYFENGLVADGDPAVAFGPKPAANGTFSWSNGWRLYYANISSNFSADRSESAFGGAEAVTVSRLDDVNFAGAMAGNNNAWDAPVIASKQNSGGLFSDHEMIAVDDAASSPLFGNVYVCDAAFRGQGQNVQGNSAPAPIVLNSSSDGGQTWNTTQLSAATNNGQNFGRQDCQVNTDSKGTVYVFWQGGDPQTRQNTIFMARSFDGGKHFERPAKPVATFDQCGLVDPVGGLTFDGVAGARDGSFPSVDIANGAPNGNGPDTIVMTWCDGPTPTNTAPGPNEQAMVQYSTNGGNSWTKIGNGAEAGDRPDFPAIAISPDGRDVYLVYDGYLQPYQTTTSAPRRMQGVVRHADFTGATTTFGTLFRAPVGDARGSSANALSSEFLGDYNFIFATNTFAVATWNDAQNAADCPAVDAFRQSLVTPSTADDLPRPAPGIDCPPNFGNTDIFGGSYADPTTP
jgi:hypothetical protein